MIINHQSFKNLNFGESLEICIFKNISRLVRFLTTLDRNLTRVVKKMIRVVRNLTNHWFLVQFMIYLFMDMVLFIFIYVGAYSYLSCSWYIYEVGLDMISTIFIICLFMGISWKSMINNDNQSWILQKWKKIIINIQKIWEIWLPR